MHNVENTDYYSFAEHVTSRTIRSLSRITGVKSVTCLSGTAGVPH
jgi:hypothetical protein